MKQKLLLGLLLFAIYTQSQEENIIAELDKKTEQYVQGVTPGIAVGIIKNGEIIYERYLGYANLEHQIAIDKNTRINIASTAKQFTALMVLNLALEGKIDLEADIRTYLPSLFPKVTQTIRVRHLLNHTSGIRDYVFILEMQNKPAWRQVGLDNDDVITLLEKQEELVNIPGERYSYSNSGYTLLTAIIEKVTGTSFNDYSESFFQELGMKETSFVRRYMGVIPNRADSYSDWGNGLWLSTPAVTKLNGDGFLYTTLRDQLTYEIALQNAANDQNNLLFKSQQPIENSTIKTYGYGLELDKRLGHEAQFHSGSTFGYHSHINRFPEDKLSVFVMSNKGSVWSGTIADELSALLLPSIEEKKTYNERISESVNNLELSEILGQYLSPEGDLIRIVSENDKILWKYANYNPYELIKEGENLFVAAYNSAIKIRFFNDELVRFYDSGKTIAYKKQQIPAATNTDLKAIAGHYFSKELNMDFQLLLNEQHKLQIKFSNRDRVRSVVALNRNELLASNFRMKIIRNQLDEITDILITLNDRAKNNRFNRKKSN